MPKTHLAIKNWQKYQSVKDGAPARYIKEYTDRDSDSDYMNLTCLQRYVYDGIRRLRARFGKDVPNDAMFIARALCVMPKERKYIANAVTVLIERGFLTCEGSVPTVCEPCADPVSTVCEPCETPVPPVCVVEASGNEQVSVSQTSLVKKSKEKNSNQTGAERFACKVAELFGLSLSEKALVPLVDKAETIPGETRNQLVPALKWVVEHPQVSATDKFPGWYNAIVTAANPMAMIASKADKLLLLYETQKTRKQVAVKAPAKNSTMPDYMVGRYTSDAEEL